MEVSKSMESRSPSSWGNCAGEQTRRSRTQMRREKEGCRKNKKVKTRYTACQMKDEKPNLPSVMDEDGRAEDQESNANGVQVVIQKLEFALPGANDQGGIQVGPVQPMHR